jgi:hypothetical protein
VAVDADGKVRPAEGVGMLLDASGEIHRPALLGPGDSAGVLQASPPHRSGRFLPKCRTPVRIKTRMIGLVFARLFARWSIAKDCDVMIDRK